MSKHVTFQLDPITTDKDEKWKEALALYHGEGEIKKDEKTAFHLFNDLANSGHEPSMLELGCMYFLGSGVEKSFTHAKKWWKKLIHDPEALYGLGLVYFFGREEEYLTPDKKKAEKCWKRAAHGNNFNAVACLEKYFPLWKPSNDTSTSIYFEKGPLLVSPNLKPNTHFFTSGADTSLSPGTNLNISIDDTFGRRQTSLVHEISRSNIEITQFNEDNSSTSFPSEKIEKMEKTLTEHHASVLLIQQSLIQIRDQIVDVQATVNVINNEMIKDSAVIQDSLPIIQSELSTVAKRTEALENVSGMESLNSSKDTTIIRQMKSLNGRVDKIEDRLNNFLETQLGIKRLLGEILEAITIPKEISSIQGQQCKLPPLFKQE